MPTASARGVAGANSTTTRGAANPTVDQIETDRLTRIANEYWAPFSAAKKKPYEPRLIDDIYRKEIDGTLYNVRRIMLLEYSQYLECYLWPNFDPSTSSKAHLMSIVVVVNEKFRERVPAWTSIRSRPDIFPGFFRRVREALLRPDGHDSAPDAATSAAAPASSSFTFREQTALVIFVIHCFNSVEVDMVRLEIQKLVSLQIWSGLHPARREAELEKSKKLRKIWASVEKKMAVVVGEADEDAERRREDADFLRLLIHRFLSVVSTVHEPLPSGELDRHRLRYVERVLELLTDLEALLPTRRFFNAILHASHAVVRCALSKLAVEMRDDEGRLFAQLLERLRFYEGFEIDDFSGEALTDGQMLLQHYNDFTSLQKATYKEFGAKLNKFSLANVGSVDTRTQLLRHFQSLEKRDLVSVASHLYLLPKPEEDEKALEAIDTKFALEILVTRCERRVSQLDALNDMPLYPTEDVIWDENLVPSAYYSGEGCLALPKLNLQFLTLHDYLLRNFTLFRLESTYEIREDIQDNVVRMKPFKAEDATVGTVLGGWARMAQAVLSFSIVEVAKPNIGYSCPSSVRADVTVTLSSRREIREEWEGIRKHDVMFLVTVRAPNQIGTKYDYKKPFIPQVGLTYVRGCEVEGMLDEQGRVIEEGPEPPPKLPGQRRTYRVWLDCNQYQQDMQRTSEGHEDVYDTFNILMRRKPKENNFKAVLETIRELMNTDCVVPNWLVDIVLGYGDPGAAHYTKMKNRPGSAAKAAAATMDFNDTFLSLDHLKNSFPDHEVVVAVDDDLDEDVVSLAKPPFRLTFPELEEEEEEDEEAKKSKKKRKKKAKKRGAEEIGEEEPVEKAAKGEGEETERKEETKEEKSEEEKKVENGEEKPQVAAASAAAAAASRARRLSHRPKPKLIVEPYAIPSRGPYPFLVPKKNAVPFTPTQIEAIRSGMQNGLTMVVGPPGTGKTDVAVQIISNIYHNFPKERTLIITHSNQALNQLFEKVMALDIDERHLLRMGRGEEMLATEKDFSKYGRVNYVLAHRLELLEEVGRLQKSIDVPGDVGYTCETAGHFYLHQILARWETFHVKLAALRRNHVDHDASFEAELPVPAVSAAATELPTPPPAASRVGVVFPFTAFFANAPQPLFPGKSLRRDTEVAEGCYRYIKKIFEQLEEYRAFELLRTGADRAKYLLIKEAKIIAMTCTHAALKRKDFVKAGFKYDNVIMEESAQILEIETFIPLLLQNPELDGSNRLKRWIMIGDHHQLPPVIKNMSFQKYSNMEQSLFTRFVRLGVPTVDLDAQGRARPTISGLYSWRYKKLGNLPHIYSYPEFKVANAGFFYDHQVINVEDFNGVGESEPNPHFYQNLAEAEFVVATFMYMRTLGYPAQKISILTTYNGQKHLIRDVLHRRCGNNPMLGFPSKVTTVDRFQGQQNDFILLSLVRTKTVGHLRDVRRLIVAMSRARLGLYIFGRVSLFRNCYELTPAFSQLCSRPTQLHLAPWELFPTQRPWDAEPNNKPLIIENMPHMAQFVFDMFSQKINFIAERIEEEKARAKDDWQPPPEAKAEEKEEEVKEEEKEEIIVNEVGEEAEDLDVRMGLKKKGKRKKEEGEDDRKEEEAMETDAVEEDLEKEVATGMGGAAADVAEADKNPDGDTAEGMDVDSAAASPSLVEVAPSETSAAPPEDSAAPPEDSAAMPEDSGVSLEDSAEPREDSAEPREDSAEPREDSAEPREDSAEPREDSAEPREDSAEPREDSAEPREDSAAKGEDSAAPREDSAAPREDSAAPGEESVPPPGEEGHVDWVRRQEEEEKKRKEKREAEEEEEEKKKAEDTDDVSDDGEATDDEEKTGLPFDQVVEMTKVVDDEEVERLRRENEEEDEEEDDDDQDDDETYNPMEQHPGAASDSDEDIS